MAAQDIEYRSLIFSFIDNFKPQPDGHKGKKRIPQIRAATKPSILETLDFYFVDYFVVSWNFKHLNFFVQEILKCLIL